MHQQPDPDSTRFEQGHALVVGVGADLPNTVDDATGLAGILRDPARCAYPPEHVHLLTGPQAGRQPLLAALDTLAQATTSQSTVVFYFSGHGYRAGAGYYLMPHGYDVNQLDRTAISGEALIDRLRRIPAQKLLILLDCCHAGGIGQPSPAGLPLTKAPLPPQARELLAEGQGRVLIASSQEQERSFAGRPYSAFTLALIEALSGVGVGQRDGYVRVADLALHAREKVPQRTRGRQHPILHFEQADNFVLAYYAGGATQPKGLPFAGEPEIEPEPGAWTALDQRGQTVHGPQTNIAGAVQGPVFSGTFHGPVATGQGEAVDLRDSQGVVFKPAGPVEQHFGDRTEISAHITGDVSGTVNVGSHNVQIGSIETGRPESTGDDRAQLAQLLEQLRARVAAQAPPDQQPAALRWIEELEQAITAPAPDLTTMEYVQHWFARQLPSLAPGVTEIILHPAVESIVAAACETLASEYRRRFLPANLSR